MFRHGAGTEVFIETGNIKLAQELLGHRDIQTTANIYTHAGMAQKIEAGLALDKAFSAFLWPTVAAPTLN
jgi:integrase